MKTYIKKYWLVALSIISFILFNLISAISGISLNGTIIGIICVDFLLIPLFIFAWLQTSKLKSDRHNFNAFKSGITIAFLQIKMYSYDPDQKRSRSFCICSSFYTGTNPYTYTITLKAICWDGDKL